MPDTTNGTVTKYIFVTGGVISGVGKGITAASLGRVFESQGLKVNIQKCDPYLNVDAGTLNPAEHGECFVTVDGAETDLDLGHYERYMDVELTQSSSLMSGKVLRQLIEDERNGKYLGKTVQVIPHFTKAIQEHILKAGEGFDVHIVEIGGTVGDYESIAFIEAIRSMSDIVGRENCQYVHVVYVPYLGTSKEYKTKPAQNAVRDLRSTGISPDVLIVRSEQMPPSAIVEKLHGLCGVPVQGIVMLPNVGNVFTIPRVLLDSGLTEYMSERLKLPGIPDLKDWDVFVTKSELVPTKTVKIGIVAKYLDNEDTYLSVLEALKSAGWDLQFGVTLSWVDAEKITSLQVADDMLQKFDGILVPGGFGSRGVEGKIIAAWYALENKIPYLGLCLGLQVAVIAAARRAGLTAATSLELDPTSENAVVSVMTDQKGKENTGGTMRLGSYTAELLPHSLAARVYGSLQATDRHRHRFECNNEYRDSYESWGIKATGLSKDGSLVELIEATDHPYFLATQAHPEFSSRPNRSQPMFVHFLKACSE
jgi:CTP synthase